MRLMLPVFVLFLLVGFGLPMGAEAADNDGPVLFQFSEANPPYGVGVQMESLRDDGGDHFRARGCFQPSSNVHAGTNGIRKFFVRASERGEPVFCRRAKIWGNAGGCHVFALGGCSGLEVDETRPLD